MFKNAARAFESLATLLAKIAMGVAGLSALAVMGLVCYSVFMRYFLNAPVTWADETAGWLVVAIVMLAAPEAQRIGEHIGVDALTEKLKGGARRLALVCGALAVLATALVLVVEGLDMVVFSRDIGIAATSVPGAKVWVVQVLVPIGAALLALIALSQMFCRIAGIEPRDSGAHAVKTSFE